MSLPSRTTLAIGASAGLLLSACSTYTPDNSAKPGSTAPPPNELALAAGIAPEQAAAARKLYLLKCAKCHRFYDPAGYTKPEWETWMRKMSQKARLTSEQTQLLAPYLEAFRKNRAAN